MAHAGPLRRMTTHLLCLLLGIAWQIIACLGASARTSVSSDCAKLQPHRRCHGARLYYTPLVLDDDVARPILGICDSSCLPISSVSVPVGHASFQSTSGSFLYYCDNTVTLPENDLDPALYAHKFPFHARTCFVTKSADHGLHAQIEFEKACQTVQGQFTNPRYKTWLPGSPRVTR